MHQLGLDQPFFVQYAHFMLGRAARRISASATAWPSRSSTLIAERLPATLELAITASVLSLVIGVPIGVYTGI